MKNKILIIEDEPMVRDMLQKHLEKLEYDILVASHGLEGLELFKKEQPPVVVMDLKMPEMDGIAFLRQLDPEIFDKHSFIVLTGHGGDEEIEECYQLGVQSFLRKPVNFFELRGTIKRSFDQLNNTREVRQLNSRFTSLMHHIPDWVWECDAENRFTYVSNNVEQTLEYSPQELIGRDISELLIEEDLKEFQLKWKKDLTDLRDIRGIHLNFKHNDGSPVPMQLSANTVFDEKGNPIGRVGICRDLRALSHITKGMEKIAKEMTIRINDQLEVIYIDERVKKYLALEPETEDNELDFRSFVQDGELLSLFPFAFDQKEDLPFTVEVKLGGDGGKEHYFNVKFIYCEEDHTLAGQLIPVGTEDQLTLMNEEIEKKENDLRNSVVLDARMRQSILTDSNNLASEILTSIKDLDHFAFNEEEFFNLDAYKDFVSTKNIYQYREHLRLLGNKIHGLKGNSGFLIPESKLLCHRVEEITHPLAENKIVLTASLARLLKQFVFKIQEMLEQYQENHETVFVIDDWLKKVDASLEQAKEYIGAKAEPFAKFITQRSIDHGEVRKRKEEDYLSVSQTGYETLAHQVKSLFFMLSETLTETQLIQTSNLYNEFLDTHQQIKKVPVDLSRYERLTATLAEQYDKEAQFLFNDYQVRADREFWNSMHEIFNHALKNAVIHGLETIEERRNMGKDITGKVTVDIREDALQIYVTISDDGKGLNIAKIKEKAIENQVVSQDKLSRMSDEEIYNLVFAQGVSTTESLDDNAGRGVGMNAVQEAMHRFQGVCQIESEAGKGTSWNFTFPKSNVSLPCFIVTIGDFNVAIPEDSVEAFHGYDTENITHINQKPAFRHHQEVIPLVDSREVFDNRTILSEEGKIRRILVLKPKDEDKIGLVINDIIHYATLPILPLPEEYRQLSSYIGATLLGSEPVLVLNANQSV